MSPLSPIEPDAEEEWGVTWEIREATHDDVPAVVTGVRELLVELGRPTSRRSTPCLRASSASAPRRSAPIVI